MYAGCLCSSCIAVLWLFTTVHAGCFSHNKFNRIVSGDRCAIFITNHDKDTVTDLHAHSDTFTDAHVDSHSQPNEHPIHNAFANQRIPPDNRPHAGKLPLRAGNGLPVCARIV